MIVGTYMAIKVLRKRDTKEELSTYFDVADSVTLISKLDISDPLHLHPNDTTALTVVSIKLKRNENYQVWLCAMLLALERKNKIGFNDGSCKRSNTNEVLGKQWDWEELKETYDNVDGSIMFGLHNQINTLQQNGSSIADYYHKLNALWKQYDAMIELPKCVCNDSEGFKKHNQLLKLMQFLMGLDDSYMQIRSSILFREVLPDVRSAYATISSEESHKVIVGSLAGSFQRNQASAFVYSVPNSQNFQRSNQNFSTGPSRPNNLNNNRQGGGSGLNNNRQCGGIGEQCEGLHYYNDQGIKSNNSTLRYQCFLSGHEWHCRLGHLADPVLNVLKDSLSIDKKENSVCCEICQRAKQTREPFSLSDHTSKRLGDLVHLDL
ncbi:ribonuclease H-like domain-containing protein [Tanacetum coccineum]